MPGDIVELHVGDRVPADLRVLQLRTATVRAEQASLTGVCGTCLCVRAFADLSLSTDAQISTSDHSINMRTQHPLQLLLAHTGESVSVLKSSDFVAKEECELQGKENMLFAGTAISNGICVGCVVAIGMETEIGKVQSQIQVCVCMYGL